MSRSSDKVMKLNVGGVFYTTLKATLATYHGTYLWRIAMGNQYCPKDDRGNYVIDRDGHCFRHILNFLRTSHVLLPTGFRDLEILREEARFYGLDEMVKELNIMLEKRFRKRRGRGLNKRFSSSMGENMHQIQEDDDLDFFEDSYLD
ncbi:hypothetical protein LOTGIDRAFT_153206 [Lottia gigantea]|uniref:BTB domain-containing protein n=1 Tax=Lottia gigantea TaxID=225164 RepID=V4AAF3_LOTGI|nr:hypothetical protein LOTGIDRAFT_153206 [Lottia gigantea]ESO93747.1 hypothetical protein LOTGIDRAFT_153206 [Lottia gigantea]